MAKPEELSQRRLVRRRALEPGRKRRGGAIPRQKHAAAHRIRRHRAVRTLLRPRADAARVLLPIFRVSEQRVVLAGPGVRRHGLGLRQRGGELNVHRERGTRLDGSSASRGWRVVPEQHRGLIDGKHALEFALVRAVQRRHRHVHAPEVMPRGGRRLVAAAGGDAVRALGGLDALVEEHDVHDVGAALQRGGGVIAAGGSEGEVDGLLPRGDEPDASRVRRVVPWNVTSTNTASSGDSCIALACIAMLTMPPMPPDMDVNPARWNALPDRTTGVHGLTTTVTTADPPAAVACGALRQIERLLNVDDELAVVRVGLRGRGSATHGAKLYGDA